MCVTNTTSRRPPAIALQPEMVANSSSMLSQRLFSNLYAAAAADTTAPAEQTVTSYPCDMFNVPSISNNGDQEKPRPKRRRKPQKPGKTAKQNDRHFVVHNYHDHANDADENDMESDDAHRRRGGVSVAFPMKLHAVLDQVEADGLAHVISWQHHGRCFIVHKPKEFVDHVMPKYFRQTKLTSFQRQLNLYGFSRLTRGNDAGGYYHELFLRSKIHLCKRMQRVKVKGTKFKAASSPESEPDFYKMPPVTVTPVHSSDEEYSYGSAPQEQQQFTPVAQMPQSSFDPLHAGGFSSIVTSAPVESQAASMYNQYAPLQAVSQPSYADQILDEAVDELFLQEAMLENSQAWDMLGDDASLPDEQLGMLLEQLLEE